MIYPLMMRASSSKRKNRDQTMAKTNPPEKQGDSSESYSASPVGCRSRSKRKRQATYRTVTHSENSDVLNISEMPFNVVAVAVITLPAATCGETFVAPNASPNASVVTV